MEKETKYYLLRLTPKEHKWLRKMAAELDLSIKNLLLKGVKVLEEEHDKKEE